MQRMRTTNLLNIPTILSLLIVVSNLSAQETYRQEYPLPTPGVPESLGVNIHFTDPANNHLGMLARAGFKWIRMDFSWSSIEQKEGVYDFSAYDKLMEGLDRYHIRPIFILDYGNDLYQKGAPTTPAARQAFCDFVDAAVTHFRHRGILWEMWNEPNGGFWNPHADANQYSDLALQVGQTIRRAAPDEWYIGPAMAGMDFTFLETCFKRGLLKYWDAVSFHPYRDQPPETAAPDFAHVRQLIAQYAPGKHIPILSGEWGYSEKYPGLNLKRQSRFVVREFLFNMANRLRLSIWYDWHDDGLSPTDPEHHFGLVYNDYKPKPAYQAVVTLYKSLNGYKFNKRLALKSSDDYCLLFSKGENTRIAVWTTSKTPHSIHIPCSPGQFTETAALGENTLLSAGQNGLVMTVTHSPSYLIPHGKNKLLSLADVWQPLNSYYSLRDSSQALKDLRNVAKLQSGKADKFPNAFVMVHIIPANQKAQLLFTCPLGAVPKRPTSSLIDRSDQKYEALAALKIDKGSPWIQQRTTLIQNAPLNVVPIGMIGEHPSALVENISGVPFHGLIKLLGDYNSTVSLNLAKGEKEKRISFDSLLLHADSYTEQFMIAETARPNIVHQVYISPIYRVDKMSSSDFSRVKPGSPLSASGFNAWPDGDPKVASTIQAIITDSAPGLMSATAHAAQINYQFHEGWKFLRVTPPLSLAGPIAGKPYALGLWIYGDDSNNALRIRFTDGTDQTFQPDGGSLNWKGWRYVEFRLSSRNSGRWGGADDGVIHYPIHLDTVLLIDSNRSQTEGSVEFTDISLIYKEN